MAAPSSAPPAERRRPPVAAPPVPTAPAKQVAQAAPAAARAAAATAIAGALVAFLAAQQQREREWLTSAAAELPPRDVAALLAEEESRGREFASRSAARLASALPGALAIPDSELRAARVAALLEREKRYAGQRAEAMASRAFAAIARVGLRAESPAGAFWKLSPLVKEHTPGCLFMGGKFWPWAVLNRVHPPRHAACPCELHGEAAAIAAGWMTAGDVPSVKDAVRAAAGIVMEAEVAEGLLAELELRDALVESGAVDADALAGIPLGEAFDPAEKRDEAGKWTKDVFKLPRYDGPKTSNGAPFLKSVRVELLRPSQSKLSADGLKRARERGSGRTPEGVQLPDGSVSIRNGHHRAAVAIERGEEHVMMNVDKLSSRRVSRSVPSAVEGFHEWQARQEELKPKPWTAPPAPVGKAGERAGAGGYSSDKAYGTNTELGRAGEEAFVKIVGGRILHPEGKGEQSPLDVHFDGYAFEVKAVSRRSLAYKATPKPFEQDQKEKAAKELGVKPALAIVVMDSEGKRAHAYYRDGLAGGRLSEGTGWKYLGSTVI